MTISAKCRYDYLSFWDIAFKTQGKEGFIPEILEELNKIKFYKVLELGSGAGMMSQILKENFDIKLTSIDIVGGNFYSDIFFKGDITKMDFGKYDLIFGRFILMHIKPEHIKSLIKKINNKSKHVCFLEYYPEKEKALDIHNFSHEYPWEYRRMNEEVVLFLK